MPAARIGPTVCELDGPMPILKRSKALIVTSDLLLLEGLSRIFASRRSERNGCLPHIREKPDAVG